jgi:DNA-binding response OmpR family regulator
MKKILIIEQDPMILECMSAFLKGEGFDVYTSFDSRVGVITAIRVMPDLIISSLNPNDNSEFDVCKALKKIPATSFIPVIFITSRPQDVQVGMQLGANDFLSKPFSNSQMLSTINNNLMYNPMIIPVYYSR